MEPLFFFLYLLLGINCGLCGVIVKRVASVLVNITAKKINKTFSYIIPESLDFIDVGWRVIVPFGPRTMEGFVLEVGEREADQTLKPILDTWDDGPWFNENTMELAQWISQYYLCTLTDAMRLFIPGKTSVKNVVRYRAVIDNLFEYVFPPGIHQRHIEVLSYLADKGSCSFDKLKNQFGNDTYKLLQQLQNKNMVIRETAVKASAKAIYKKKLQVTVNREELGAFIAANEKKRPAQVRLLRTLQSQNSVYDEDIKELGITSDTVKRLIEEGIVSVTLERTIRDSYQDIKKSNQKVCLSPQQQSVLEEIAGQVRKKQSASFLLHGITGSGKTQVYIEAVEIARNMQRKAIVLVPEIALTGQIVARFKARFGDDVIVIHSKLSAGERFDAWQRLQKNEAGIVIGARSAIFAPISNLGIIIVDEEHEFTYKQEESPRYHVRQVALEKVKVQGCVVVFGSATPSIETYYEALAGTHKLLTMSERIDNAVLPEVTVVDMRQELQMGRKSVISLPLQELLKSTLAKKEQAIILLNRRGYATFVMCRECGYIVRCKQCDISMVYHSVGNRLRCHYCQREEAAPTICPSCESRYIRYFGTGTQKLEEELTKYFPEARVIRMDQDTTGGKLSHDRILSSFARGEYDILLGTQMVAKGHDVKNVTAVGIIAADSILNLPDFRAAERVFSLITQAAGRAGRGDKAGKVIVQTYNPEHYAVKAGAMHDYEDFYRAEIDYRKSLKYPPLSQFVKFTIQAEDGRKVEYQAQQLINRLKESLCPYKHTEIIGPFWSSIARLRGIFRMNILLKTTNLEEIRSALLMLEIEENTIVDVDPVSLM